jgi:hypothetical protein
MEELKISFRNKHPLKMLHTEYNRTKVAQGVS